MQINGFCSAKSMVELTCHILENATTLESLTVDTLFSAIAPGNKIRCSERKNGECMHFHKKRILEAHEALMAVKRHILGRVPSTVTLNVGEPRSRCSAKNGKFL